MESYNPNINLLSRFSNAKWVLSFFDEYFGCHVLMNSLHPKTRQCWKNSYAAFCNALEYVRQPLKYAKTFDKYISEYLLEGFRYKRYTLTLELNDEASYEAFLEFVS